MTSKPGQRQAARELNERLGRQRRRRRMLWTSAITVAALLVAALIGWGVYASRQADTYTAPAGAADNNSGIAVGGGPVTVDVYEDFLCPVCRQFESQAGTTLDQLVTDGRIRAVYHPVAYLDRASSTAYSTRSSAASGCAAEGGRFREYGRALFERQPSEGGAGLTDDELISIGAGVGLDEGTFGTCVRDGTFKSWTAHVTNLASDRGVRGTPTIYVAGKPVQATADAIRAAVDAEPR